MAPDANGTLRVTYGRVLGVRRDGLFFKPQTTLAGIVEKATGDGISTRRRELDAIRALRAGTARRPTSTRRSATSPSIPLHRGHHGRELGSADAQREGRAVRPALRRHVRHGCADYLYDTDKTRSIHVDSRYMLWAMLRGRRRGAT